MPGLRDGELGARLRRLRTCARPRDAAAHPLARRHGARALRRRLGGRLAGRRLAAPGAERQVERARAAGLRADVRLRARVLPLQGELRRGAREALPRPHAVGPVHPRLPHPRDDLRRAADPARSAAACTAPGIPVEFSKGEAWPGQHEINFRYADAVTIGRPPHDLQERRQGDRLPERLSTTFMAKPDQRGSAARATSTRASGATARSAFVDGESDRRLPITSSPARSRARRELALFVAPTINSYKRYAAGSLGADVARLGARQPHLRLPRRRPRAARARRVPDPGRRRQPVPRVRGADRGRPRRDRAGDSSAGRSSRATRTRPDAEPLPVDAARGDRGARGQRRSPARRSATTSSTTTSTTARTEQRLFDEVVTDYERERAVRARLMAVLSIGITTYVTPARFGRLGRGVGARARPTTCARSSAPAGGRCSCRRASDGVEETLDALDGLIFSGGSDLDPELYGQEPHPETDGDRRRARPRRARAAAGGARARHAGARDLPRHAGAERRARRRPRPAPPGRRRPRAAQAHARACSPTTT